MEQAPRRRNPWKWLVLGVLGLMVLGFVGCTVIIGALAVAGSSGSGGGGAPVANDQAKGGGGSEAQQPPDTEMHQVGEKVTVGNVQWSVDDAYTTGRLESGFGTSKEGDFLVVDFTFTNNRDEEVTLDPQLHMVLKDSEGREFGSDVDTWEFVPTEKNIFLEPVNPGLSQTGRLIYEIAPDAKDFTLTVNDVEMMGDQEAVFDLGNIPEQGASNASASASASAY